MSRRPVYQAINTKLKGIVKAIHVEAIVNILLDEIQKDFIDGKKIKVLNLGIFSVEDPKPRNYFDRLERKVKFSLGKRILRAEFTNKLRKRLLKLLDIDKSFKDD